MPSGAAHTVRDEDEEGLGSHYELGGKKNKLTNQTEHDCKARSLSIKDKSPATRLQSTTWAAPLGARGRGGPAGLTLFAFS